jgi:hypothetical protein
VKVALVVPELPSVTVGSSSEMNGVSAARKRATEKSIPPELLSELPARRILPSA